MILRKYLIIFLYLNGIYFLWSLILIVKSLYLYFTKKEKEMRYSFLYIKFSISLMFGGKLSCFTSFIIIIFLFSSFLPILNDQSDTKIIFSKRVDGLQLFPTLLIRFDSLLYQIKNESKGSKLFKVSHFLYRRMREHMIRNSPFRLFS